MPAPSGPPVQVRDAPDKPLMVNEPSMEDILASIRRIIAADQTGLPLRGGFAAPAVEQPATQTAFDPPRAGDLPPSLFGARDPAPADKRSEPAVPRLHDYAADLAPRYSVAADHLPHPAEAAETFDGVASAEAGSGAPEETFMNDIYDLHASEKVDPADFAEPLISAAAGASVSSSFQALVQSVLVNDPEMIERLARDALRPMLKAWLDENLPGMVERLVRSEIERVARGGRTRD